MRGRTLPFGFNVIGYVSSNFGQGAAARNTIRLLLGRGYEVAAIDVSSGTRPTGRDTRYGHLLREPGDESPYAVNIFHLNPPEILRLVGSDPPWLDMADRLNVAIPFWELTRFPRLWLRVLRHMDLVLAPSRFIYDALACDLSESSLQYYPQAVEMPEDIRPDRARWGLPPTGTVFAMSFDTQSDLERKNPWAALTAFGASASGTTDVNLLVKLSAPPASGRENPSVAALRLLAARDTRIMLREDDLSYHDLLGLYASCDAFVSLHRSEGLGLVVLEAMALGKPTIVTAWSGTMDFTTAENSCLVPFRLMPARGSLMQYSSMYVGRRVVWADPDVAAAGRCMERIAGDSTYAAEIGGRAKLTITRATRLAHQSPWPERCRSRHLTLAREDHATGGADRSSTAAALRRQNAVYRGLASIGRRAKSVIR